MKGLKDKEDKKKTDRSGIENRKKENKKS